MKTKSLNIRVEPRLMSRLKTAAAHKKWPITTFVEEAIIEKLAIEEELRAAKK
jgi:predicted HicB family RNase H-like nuclease